MTPDDVLSFWIGPLDDDGLAAPDAQKRWWSKDPELDRTCAERFGELHGKLAANGHPAWRETPRGLLAVVIVLDQLSRNIHRDATAMYAADPLALGLAKTGLERDDFLVLRAHERLFLYMPLMHSEALADQERCVGLFAGELAATRSEPLRAAFGQNLRFARQHRDIVARFGRFPHRNAILGRASTAEEEAFLKEPGSSF